MTRGLVVGTELPQNVRKPTQEAIAALDDFLDTMVNARTSFGTPGKAGSSEFSTLSNR